MYKSPELSAKARLIRQELSTLGFEIPQHAALKVAAKVDGFKSVHVAQAKKNKQGIDAHALASRQAATALFASLGKYENDVNGLLITLDTIFQSDESRQIEARIHELTTADGVKLSSLGELYRWDELGHAFEELRQNLLASLEKMYRPPEEAQDQPDLVCQVLDWEIGEGTPVQDVPEHHRQPYELKVKRSGYQLYVDLMPPHQHPDEIEGQAQLTLFIEVNRGLPCVHISNDAYGDSVLSVFGTQEGLYLRPNGSDCSIRTGVLKEGTQMRRLHDEDTEGLPSASFYRAFILPKD